MSLSSRDYAALARNAYEPHEPGRRGPDSQEPTYIGEHQYKILEHVDDLRTGYQGTLYQHVRTRNLIVAHRGTEELLKDGVITDASMVLARASPQAVPALALTLRATEDAVLIVNEQGRPIDVTVTGHSLGGTLAQITAHHYNLKGETFNAYGAASLLGLRIPEGGGQAINHAMAADAVSAASPHFGEVRLYATQRELEALGKARYGNSAFNVLIPKLPLVAAAATLDSHRMDQFTGDESVLANKTARAGAPMCRHLSGRPNNWGWRCSRRLTGQCSPESARTCRPILRMIRSCGRCTMRGKHASSMPRTLTGW
jgi:pimeloyl-ACP methyl ester carboxylesterase